MKYLILAALIAVATARSTPPPKEKPSGPPFPCLSPTDTAIQSTCENQVNRKGSATKASASGSDSGAVSTSCMPKCIMQELNALDSSNQIKADALIAVITRTNLTTSQKTSATNTLKACLANTTTDAAAIEKECGNKNTVGRHWYFRSANPGSHSRNDDRVGELEDVTAEDFDSDEPEVLRSRKSGTKAPARTVPPKNTTPECEASAKGLACLGKALSSNKCGPACGGKKPAKP